MVVDDPRSTSSKASGFFTLGVQSYMHPVQVCCISANLSCRCSTHVLGCNLHCHHHKGYNALHKQLLLHTALFCSTPTSATV